MRPRNTFTNISGRAKFERFVTAEAWHGEILPVLKKILPMPPFHARAKIGAWVIEAVGDDPHMHDFFTQNWQPTSGQIEPHIRAWHINHCKDRVLLHQILGIKTEADLAARRTQFSSFLEDPLFKICLKDPDYLSFSLQTEARQNELAVFAPAFICCPEERVSISLNTNYYGQFKSKCILGILEEFLIRGEEFWLSMHAGGSEYWSESGAKRGVVIVGPTGTAKSTHAYGLTRAKKQNRFHSDDWLIANVLNGEVLAVERSFYMRTPMARFYPEIMDKFLSAPLENVPFSEESLKRMQNTQTNEAPEKEKTLRDLCLTPAARTLCNSAELFPAEKRSSSMRMTDLFVVKRDENSVSVIQKITKEELIRFLISSENVFQYRRNPDRIGEEIFDRRTTEYYLNPYLCRTDFYQGTPGELDQRRIDAWEKIAGLERVNLFELNAFLPVPVTQFALRRFLEGGVEQVVFEKGRLEFYGLAGCEEAVSFDYNADFMRADRAALSFWSNGRREDFFKRYEFLNAAQLFREI